MLVLAITSLLGAGTVLAGLVPTGSPVAGSALPAVPAAPVGAVPVTDCRACRAGGPSGQGHPDRSPAAHLDERVTGPRTGGPPTAGGAPVTATAPSPARPERTAPVTPPVSTGAPPPAAPTPPRAPTGTGVRAATIVDLAPVATVTSSNSTIDVAALGTAGNSVAGVTVGCASAALPGVAVVLLRGSASCPSPPGPAVAGPASAPEGPLSPLISLEARPGGGFDLAVLPGPSGSLLSLSLCPAAPGLILTLLDIRPACTA